VNSINNGPVLGTSGVHMLLSGPLRLAHDNRSRH